MLAFWRKGSKGVPRPDCIRETQGVFKTEQYSESAVCTGPSESPCKELSIHPKQARQHNAIFRLFKSAHVLHKVPHHDEAQVTQHAVV